MELKATEILQKIDPQLAAYPGFEEAVFTMNPILKHKSKVLELNMKLKHVLPFSLYESLLHKLRLATRCQIDLTLTCEEGICTLLELKEYIGYFVSLHPQYRIFDEVLPAVEERFIVYRIADAQKRDQAVLNRHHLDAFLKKCGIQMESAIEELKLHMEVMTVKGKAEAPKPVPVMESKPKYYKPKGKRALDQYTPYQIAEIKEAGNGIRIRGKVFDSEIRELRSGKCIQSLWVGDDSDAIVVKRFERGSLTREELEKIKTGSYIDVYGRAEYDTFARELVMTPDAIMEIEEVKRQDQAEEKRVELHVHTKLSEMDGVCNIEEFIKQADAWGMDAIACTDHMVVQAFPKAQHCVSAINKGREKPFKMIYGIEMNMVDPQLQIVRNADDTELEKGEYCVFDLETTGLSSRYDHIIEFGGQIVKDRTIVKELQLFIKPPQHLSAFTISLTNITEEDVKDAPSIEAAIDQILDFIGDRILVAHNAGFDVNFLNDALIRMGREPLQNPVIDTLDLARSLQSDRRGYRLGQIAHGYGIRYDEDVAHRADYDAQVLAQVYLHMLNDLKEIKTLKDLQDMQSEQCFNKVRKKHVTILAKNAAGLKELFELVTLSHCNYLAYNGKNVDNVVAEPRIPRFEIEKRRRNGNLLIGTSCLNGEIFDLATTRELPQLKEAMQFYDYVEIQPIDCYKHLVETNKMADMDRLYAMLRDIIDCADALGKTLVATGDAHYVHPSEKMIRDIYISSQAIGGARHPLYIYNTEKRRKLETPKQHFLTTDEMLKAFAWVGETKAYEMVVTNTRKIADQIEVIYPVKDRLYPPDMEGSDEKLKKLCYENAYRIYGDPLPEIVEKRLEKELKSIIGHGFYVVYYISHLLVKKSLNDGYLVGSRGSVGSSFVATMAEITEVNPLPPHYVCPHCHYSEFFTDGSVASGFDLPDKKCPVCGATIRGDGQDIPFETFLGFEGDKVPDIDLNFSGDYQPYAHAYTKEVFGEDHVFRAGTIGTVAQQTAFGYVKRYEEEMGKEGMLRRAQELRLAKGCEGVKRTTGQHPGGIIVIPLDMDVHDFTPVQYPANNPFAEWKTTHFEFHDIHDNVLKFDILGHVDPTAMKLLERMSGVDPKSIPMNDPETMSIFSGVEALKMDTSKTNEVTGAAGLPEFGTPFVRGILELTRPTTFEELVKLSGLSHGTDVWLGNAKDLIDSGTCTLKSVIGCRDDIMVYLLHKGLAPKLAFTIMESVRKGKGLKEEWIPEMKACGVEDWYIDSCLKIKYMFPKGHAVAYVMMAVRIAWFKVHKPQYYYCMFFSIRCDAYEIETMIKGEAAIRSRMEEITAKLNSEYKNEVTKKEKDIYTCLELALEMVLRGYRFGNISLEKSEATTFVVDPADQNVIIPSFTSIDGLGESVALSIVEARQKGAFLSKQDLMDRTLLNGTLAKKMEAMGVLSGLQEENQMSLF